MLINLTFMLVSLIFLILSADKLVTGAAALANHFKWPPLLIGLTIVALGTSIPEVFISVLSSLQDNAELALGNAVGSNIANLGLVLGITTLLQPIVIQEKIIKHELPVLLLVTIGASFILSIWQINFFSGLILLATIIAYIAWLAYQEVLKKNPDPVLTQEYDELLASKLSLRLAVFWLVVGFTIVPISANELVKYASLIAEDLGINKTVIGLTAVAIGTSLPELVTSIMGVIKKEQGIVMGNIIGSNIFNLTAVLAPVGLIGNQPNLVENFYKRDLFFMNVLTLIFVIFAYRGRKTSFLTSKFGILMLASYGIYIYLLLKY